MFNEICDKHAPFKKIKIRSKSDPWITNEIRRKMNYRYKLFKTAVGTKDVFREKIDSVKSTAAYWKILSEATNPKRRPQIGPIRREDNTLAVGDEEKANLINTFFATVGTSLSRNPACQAPVETGNDPAPTQTISTIPISEESISRKSRPGNPTRPGVQTE